MVPSAFDNSRSASDVVESQVVVEVTGTNCSFANSDANSLVPHSTSLSALEERVSGSNGTVTPVSAFVVVSTSVSDIIVVVSSAASVVVLRTSILAVVVLTAVNWGANWKGFLLMGNNPSRTLVSVSKGLLVVGVGFAVLVELVVTKLDRSIGSVLVSACGVSGSDSN